MLKRISALIGRLRRRPKIEIGAAHDVADDTARVFELHTGRIPSGRQWSLLPAFLSPIERRWIRLLGTIASLSIVVIVAVLIVRHVGVGPANGGTLTIGMTGAPQFINPILARPQSVDADLTTFLFRGLVSVSAGFQAVPDLAETVTPSSDRKSYTVVLKPNLHWSDGEPLDADDVLYTFETIKDTEFGSPHTSAYESVELEATDDRTIVFKLKQPSIDFPFSLTIGIVPRHGWSDALPQTMPLAELNLKPITSSAYRFQSVTKDRTGSVRTLTFTRNRYFDGRPAYVQKIAFKFYSDPLQTIEALKDGSVDMIEGISAEQNRAISKKYRRTAFDISQLSAVFFNQQKNVVLRADEVRRALSQSTDRASIIASALPQQAVPIFGPVLPGYPGYLENLGSPQFDPVAAAKTLEDAGWKKGGSGFREKDKRLLSFTISIPDDPTYIAVATQLQKNWTDLGCKVAVSRVDLSRIQKDVIRPRQYEVLIFGQIIGAEDDLYPFWDSSEQRDPGYNLALYYNKQADRLLESARTTISPDDRAAKYRELQKIIVSDIPAIFLYQHQSLAVHSSTVRGLENSRLVQSSDLFSTASRWYVKRRLVWD